MKAARTRALNRKHAGTGKHGSTAKHTGSATRKAATAHKQVARRTASQVKAAKLRAWSPDADVAICSARAVATALELLSGPVLSDADVLSLYWTTASDPDSGQALSEALRAAEGLFGDLAPDADVRVPIADGDHRGAFFVSGHQFALSDFMPLDGWLADGNAAVPLGHLCHGHSQERVECRPILPEGGRDVLTYAERANGHPLILGLDLPWGKPHSVTYDPADGVCWSWGQPYNLADFAGAVIEEAWAVTL